MKYEEKLLLLEKIIKNYGHMTVALSGGVDSTFLLLFAQKVLKGNLIAITAHGPNFAPDEESYAKTLCEDKGISHMVVDLGEDSLNAFAHNPKDRCYICKKGIFEHLVRFLKSNYPDSVLADGTNLDDTKDYRPGQKALAELGIASPLKEANLTKAEIRNGLKALGGEIWDKPAFACLASRIPYGETITVDKLNAIYQAEQVLHSFGFVQTRVRHHGNLARIEVEPSERNKFFDEKVLDQIQRDLQKIGFLYVTMDLGGYRMGSLNEEIKE